MPTKNPILSAALAALRTEYSYTPHHGDKELPATLAPWKLASTADCAAPDRDANEGIEFLCGLFDSFIDTIEFTAIDEIDAQADGYDIRKELDRVEWHETADSAVPVYTHRKWQTFVQLAAYDEDVSELVHGREITGDDVCNAALYIIADRLMRALTSELCDLCDTAEAEAADAEAADAVPCLCGDCWLAQN